jgi:hypothetical protein
MDCPGSELCPMASIGVNGVKPSGSATREVQKVLYIGTCCVECLVRLCSWEESQRYVFFSPDLQITK